jgi:integrase
MSTLRAILNEAVINDWIFVNPFSKAKPGELISIADERKRETILTSLEEQRLLAACSTDTRRHLRALIIAALDTGARRGELLGLRWSDVRFDEGIIANIRSYKGKTVHHREVPLTARLKVALHDLKQKQCVSAFKVRRKSGLKPDEDLVFGISTTVKTSWQAAREEAGLQHVRFHDLRHTAATRLAGKMQLALVGQVLGHSDPKTTQRYVNATRQTVSQAATILEQWQDEQKLILNQEQRQIGQEIIH